MYNSPLRKRDPEIIKMYQSGIPTTTIARQIGCTTSSVQYRLKKNGVPMRSISVGKIHGQKRASNNFFDPEYMHDIYWNQKMTTDEIAEMFECSRDAVVRQMHRLGIKVRLCSHISRAHRKLVRLLKTEGVRVSPEQIDVRIPGTRYFADVLFKDAKLVVEVDGYFHTKEAYENGMSERWKTDKVRDAVTAELGYETIRVKTDRFDRYPTVYARMIRWKLHERGTLCGKRVMI